MGAWPSLDPLEHSFLVLSFSIQVKSMMDCKTTMLETGGHIVKTRVPKREKFSKYWQEN